jgi:hypothetical protein
MGRPDEYGPLEGFVRSGPHGRRTRSVDDVQRPAKDTCRAKMEPFGPRPFLGRARRRGDPQCALAR